jgi:hypothetical protein
MYTERARRHSFSKELENILLISIAAFLESFVDYK